MRKNASIFIHGGIFVLRAHHQNYRDSKEFKSIHQQVKLLESRGVTFNDYGKAKKYLLTNNYYNVINGYGNYFFDSSGNYLSGTTFEEIVKVNFYDKEIKYVFFKSIIDIERHLKSIVAFVFARKYKKNHKFYEAYSDINSYSFNFNNVKPSDVSKQINDVKYFINQSSKLVRNKKNEKNNNPIKHYLKKAGGVPIWVIIDYLTFGELLILLRYQDDSFKNEVANRFCTFITDHFSPSSHPFTSEIMVSFLEKIAEVRNICAHNNRLYNFKCRENTKHYVPLHSAYSITNRQPRSSIYNTFITMQCFLTKTEFKTLHNSLINRFRSLDNNLTTISINKLLRSLGFPDDWHTITPKIV
ncbi:Abi family protein [Streptococcus suis]|uniref:Abi family protein n=1 Tax=Streptococcus suis TaxID=1307 RepID=UPI002FCB2E4D